MIFGFNVAAGLQKLSYKIKNLKLDISPLKGCVILTWIVAAFKYRKFVKTQLALRCLALTHCTLTTFLESPTIWIYLYDYCTILLLKQILNQNFQAVDSCRICLRVGVFLTECSSQRCQTARSDRKGVRSTERPALQQRIFFAEFRHELSKLELFSNHRNCGSSLFFSAQFNFRIVSFHTFTGFSELLVDTFRHE